MAAPHVYFSRQMLKAKYKDPKTNEYRDYEHSRATGKDGKPLLMYRILLPSANHREFQFEKMQMELILTLEKPIFRFQEMPFMIQKLPRKR